MTTDLRVRLPPMHRQVLPNGLVVIVVERRTLPLVTLRLALRTGSAHDTPDPCPQHLRSQGCHSHDQRDDSAGGVAHFVGGGEEDRIVVEFTPPAE